MDYFISLAWVIGAVAVFLAALFGLSGGLLGWESRSGRIVNCFCIASAFAVLYATGVLQRMLDTGPSEMLGIWASVLLLAALFLYGAFLEVASWFGGER